MKFQIGFKVLSSLIVMLFLASLAMAEDTVTKPHTFSAGMPASAEEVNDNFDILYDKINALSAEVAALKSGGNSGSGLPPADYDSGWLPISNNTSFTMNHNLGVLPRLSIVWGSASPDGSNMVLEDMKETDGGNAVGCLLHNTTPTSYEIQASREWALSTWVKNGYVKVLMWK